MLAFSVHIRPDNKDHIVLLFIIPLNIIMMFNGFSTSSLMNHSICTVANHRRETMLTHKGNKKGKADRKE